MSEPGGNGEGREEQEGEEVLNVLGGVQGVADSSLPGLAFVGAYLLGGEDLGLAAAVAVGCGAVIALLRRLRGESLRFALAGFGVVALAAFVADRSGRAEDFFLPGLLLNALYGAAYLVSIAVRWPLIGLIVGTLTGSGSGWRRDERVLAAYTRASWIWVGVFGARLAIQLPLYLSGALLALGIAKAACGLPVFAVGVWLTLQVLRREGIDLRLPRPAG